MNRRELLKHTALLLGSSLSPAIVAGATSTAKELPSSTSNSRLSDPQRELITVLSERIIPASDTPGALEAKVPEFIDFIVSHWQTETERTAFLNGLSAIDQYCSTHFQTRLLICTEKQQISALTAFEQRAKTEKTSGDIKPFFIMLRELVVVGYFTSKPGATQALRHAHAPGAFIGDYPLKDVGKAWSPVY